MRRGPRIFTVAAALLVAAVLSGCGIAGPGPVPVVSPPPGTAQEPPSVAPPAPLAPAPVASTAGRSGKVPVVQHIPLAAAAPEPQAEPQAEPHAPPPPPPPPPPAPPAPPPSQPSASATPEPAPPSPAPAPPPELAELLVVAGSLPPLAWSGGTAAWSAVADPTAVPASGAIAHVAVAHGAGAECAAAAAAVDSTATAAATVALAAGAAPGGPYSVIVLRYATADAAGAAAGALQALGQACEGVETESGTFGTGAPTHDATVLLTADGASLVVDAMASGAHLIAVLHEGAPSEAVALLLREQAALLG